MSTQNNYIPEGFKMTELGPLPEEWEATSLENAADIIMGQSPPSSTYNAASIGLPFFQGKADFGDVYPTTRKWCSAPARIAEKDDVLLSVRAPIGDVNIAAERSCIGRGLAAIRANQKSEGKYLFYRMAFSKELLESKGTGTTFKEINKAAVTSFTLPLPPLPEQKAIAGVLSTIQKAIEAQDKIIAAARELKKSLMHHFFTYGPVPVTEAEKVSLKETEIGPVPEHWEVVRLGEKCDVKGGKRLPKGHAFADEPTSHPYIRVVDFMNGSVDLSKLRFLTDEDFQIIRNYTICADDIYISIAGTIGLVGIIPPELNGANLTENAAKLVRNRTARINNLFLKYALSTDSQQQQMLRLATKTSQPKFALARIKQVLIPFPSLPEQQEIARMLSGVDTKIEAEEKRKAAFQTLFKTMLHNLMTGKVRVKDLEVTAA